MCGIVGYNGLRNSVPFLLDGLCRLEERGYDSAGVAVLTEAGAIATVKAAGRVDMLRARLASGTLSGNVGIAHTRWATHGRPTDINAHPHVDCTGRIALVHNGIIENAHELRESLRARGHRFVSETDTEVLAHLVEEARRETTSLQEAVSRALGHAQGTWGLVVVSADSPGELIATRMGSPLLLGVGDGEMFVGSMPDAFCGRARQVVELRDGEVVVVHRDRYDGAVTAPSTLEVDEEALLGDYPYWMIKEIFEQPAAVSRACNFGGRLDLTHGTARLGGLDLHANALRDLRVLRLIGCGTALHAALYGRHLLARFGGFEAVEADIASEALDDNLGPGVGVLALSQSGETFDTLEAVREAKRRGATTLSIVNRVGRTLARETGMGIYNNAGPEKAVASTKVFVSQLTILVLLTLWFGRKRGRISPADGQEVLRGLAKLPEQIEEVLRLHGTIRDLAQVYRGVRNGFYLGRDLGYPIALEGALKLTEIAYVHAQGYAAGEMKHGPIALVDQDFLTVGVVPRITGAASMLSNLQEIKARGGPIVAVATEGMAEVAAVADHVLTVPECHPWLSPILAVIPLQLFAYEMALTRGLDPDRPRNLAKSVTVG